jgi:hypothetical protein
MRELKRAAEIERLKAAHPKTASRIARLAPCCFSASA